MLLSYFIVGVVMTVSNLFADDQSSGVNTAKAGAPAPRYNRPQTRIDNAGFELGQAHWKVIASEMIGAKVSSDSLSAYEGLRALKVDLEQTQRFSRGVFMSASPWVTLRGGGNISYSIYIKSNRPQTKAALLIFNAASTNAIRSGKLKLAPLKKEFFCSENWRQVVITGELPPAEKDNYRFVVQLTEPAVYWLDNVEILHNGQSITATPEIEAILQPLAIATKLYVAPGQVEVLLRVANHTDKARRLQFTARQRARLHAFARPLTAQFDLAPKQVFARRLQFSTPYADVYDIRWELREPNSKPIQNGALGLAAINARLPRAEGGEPVWGMHLNSVNWETALPILRDAGIRWLRNVAVLHWDRLEPRRREWQWPDSVVQYLRAQDFYILGKLGFTPKWAVGSAKSNDNITQNKMPKSIDQYRQYIHNVVSRYRHDIDCWEIGNEPNLPRYLDGTPQDYATLLAAAVTEIKAVQPNAQVAGYAITLLYKPETREYVQAVINCQPSLRLDAFALHPYATPAPEEVNMAARIDEFRGLFVARQGYSPQLWVTELGYFGKDTVNDAIAYSPPAPRRTVDELSQASYLVRAASLCKMAGVKTFFCYALDSERINRGPDIYGLLDESWIASPKPALLAYLTLATLLGDAKFEKRLDLGDPEVYLLQYQRHDGKFVNILWSTKGEKHVTLSKLPWPASEKYDLFGNRLDGQTATTVTAGPAPLYFIH